jgi:hypothetical protein
VVFCTSFRYVKRDHSREKVPSYGSMARLYKFGHAESLSVVVVVVSWRTNMLLSCYFEVLDLIVNEDF